MSYELEVNPSCQDSIKKSCKKNSELEQALRRKIEQVIQNPQHYKPLRYGFVGERRVHILKSFVLKFEIDEARKTVILLFFGHHDEAYIR